MDSWTEGLKRILAVGCGGFIGAIARYTISRYVKQRFPMEFPIGTLAVNALGCLLIGFLMALFSFGWDAPRHKDYWPIPAWLTPTNQLILVHGILGSLTTFSTLGYETLELMRTNQQQLAAASVALNLIIGITFVWSGHSLARAWLP